MSIALLFPGQGSQYSGMGKATYEAFPEARDVYDKLSSLVGFDLKRVSFEGTNDELLRTDHTQPAIFAHSAAHFELIKDKVKFEAVAGHSLGEYSAIYASGVLSLEDCIMAVRKRGELMYRSKGGGMMAVIGLEEARIDAVIESLKTRGVIVIANYNSPEQVVLSGELPLLEEAQGMLKSAGAKRIVMLPVSGAFHSPMMEKAANELKHTLDKLKFRNPDVLFYSNVTGSDERNPERIKELLILQLTSPVQWKRTIEAMVSDGADTFIEVGPGRVLGGLLKRIAPEARYFNLESPDDLKRILEALKDET